MDKSEEYVKQCDCPEIQDGWGKFAIKWGDFYWNDGMVLPVMKILAILEMKISTEKIIWLPRQDQLQEMLPNEPAWDYRFSAFSNWLDIEPGLSIFNSVDSMEQLWLGYVMAELHGKKWNEEAWVK